MLKRTILAAALLCNPVVAGAGEYSYDECMKNLNWSLKKTALFVDYVEVVEDGEIAIDVLVHPQLWGSLTPAARQNIVDCLTQTLHVDVTVTPASPSLEP